MHLVPPTMCSVSFIVFIVFSVYFLINPPWSHKPPMQIEVRVMYILKRVRVNPNIIRVIRVYLKSIFLLTYFSDLHKLPGTGSNLLSSFPSSQPCLASSCFNFLISK